MILFIFVLGSQDCKIGIGNVVEILSIDNICCNIFCDLGTPNDVKMLSIYNIFWHAVQNNMYDEMIINTNEIQLEYINETNKYKI